MSTTENIFFDLADLSHLGRSAIVGKAVRIRNPGKVQIGDYSILDDFTYISCGLTIGRYSHLGPNCTLIGGGAHITIGDFVNLSGGCRLMASSNDFKGGGLVGPAIPEAFAEKATIDRIEIGDHVLFGTGTVVLPGTVVPEGVSTGAMTLLTASLDLEPWMVYAGIPAKPIGKRDGSRMLEAARRLLASVTHSD